MKGRNPVSSFCVLAILVALSACSATTTAPSDIGGDTPRTLMLSVAKQVQACWFVRKDPALRGYKMASEVNALAGQPRILIVPANRPTGLPKLVAQAQRRGGRNEFSSFGPLLQTPDGPRLQAELNRWAAGSRTC